MKFQWSDLFNFHNYEIIFIWLSVMKAAGANQKESVQLGTVLAHADYRGHYSHGLNRLEYYYNDMKVGFIKARIKKKKVS